MALDDAAYDDGGPEVWWFLQADQRAIIIDNAQAISSELPIGSRFGKDTRFSTTSVLSRGVRDPRRGKGAVLRGDSSPMRRDRC